MSNFLSIDVEDYFQVSAFEKVSPPESWDSCPIRVESNTELVLRMLEKRNIKATFFILGWVARYCPTLVKKIAAKGHEIASHGFGHRRVSTQERSAFRSDVRDSKRLLEDLCGQEVLGYRAPSYSICLKSLWAFDELYEAGYTYDSSVFPVCHDYYGIPDWPRFPFDVERVDDACWRPGNGNGSCVCLKEIPVSTLKLRGKNVPISGGGYFRFFPYSVTRWGLRRINQVEKKPFVFYLHPWELDPDQPRMRGAGWKSSFRHYLNLHKTEDRFRQLLEDFRFGPIKDVFAADKAF